VLDRIPLGRGHFLSNRNHSGFPEEAADQFAQIENVSLSRTRSYQER